MTRRQASCWAEVDQVRDSLLAAELSYAEIAGAFGRRYKMRPRKAWWVAYDWTLLYAAEQLNDPKARERLDPAGNASMTSSRLYEYEQEKCRQGSVENTMIRLRALSQERISVMTRQASQAVPWGLRRMAYYPETVEFSFSRVVLDPETQTGIYLDLAGRPTEAGKHGTGTDTSRATGTGTDGSARGDNDSDTNPDGDQD